MGVYLNRGNAGFTSARAGKYVDKSGLIGIVNSTIGKKEKLSEPLMTLLRQKSYWRRKYGWKR